MIISDAYKDMSLNFCFLLAVSASCSVWWEIEKHTHTYKSTAEVIFRTKRLLSSHILKDIYKKLLRLKEKS